MDEDDPRRTVGIVFDRRHLAGDAVLIPLEIDDPVFPLVPAPVVPHRDLPLVVPARFPNQRHGEGFFRLVGGDLLKGGDRLLPHTRRGGLKMLDTHGSPSFAQGIRLRRLRSPCCLPSASQWPFSSCAAVRCNGRTASLSRGRSSCSPFPLSLLRSVPPPA